jgi:hypothetical protein
MALFSPANFVYLFGLKKTKLYFHALFRQNSVIPVANLYQKNLVCKDLQVSFVGLNHDLEAVLSLLQYIKTCR